MHSPGPRRCPDPVCQSWSGARGCLVPAASGGGGFAFGFGLTPRPLDACGGSLKCRYLAAPPAPGPARRRLSGVPASAPTSAGRPPPMTPESSHMGIVPALAESSASSRRWMITASWPSNPSKTRTLGGNESLADARFSREDGRGPGPRSPPLSPTLGSLLWTLPLLPGGPSSRQGRRRLGVRLTRVPALCNISDSVLKYESHGRPR